MRRIAFGALILSLPIVLGEYSASAQNAIALPQARPGDVYSAQLAIPPGLGYPFTCNMTGLPKGLTFDCARLQIAGRAPAGTDKTYSLTLKLADSQGNTETFALNLPVSTKPVAVSLVPHSAAPAPTPPDPPTSVAAQTVARPGSATTAEYADQQPTSGPGERIPAGNVNTAGDVQSGGTPAAHAASGPETPTPPGAIVHAKQPVAQPATTTVVQSGGTAQPDAAPAPAPNPVPPSLAVPVISAGLTSGSTSLTVSSTVPTDQAGSGTLQVLTMPNSSSSCDAGKDPANTYPPRTLLDPSNKPVTQVPTSPNSATQITLQDPLTAGTSICVYEKYIPAAVAGAAAEAPLAASVVGSVIYPFKMHLSALPHAGDTSISVAFDLGQNPGGLPEGASLGVLQLGSAYPRGLQGGHPMPDPTQVCRTRYGTPLALAAAASQGAASSSGSGAQSYTVAIKISPSSPIAQVNLANALSADSYVCAYVSSSGQILGATHPNLVTDPFDLGRVRTYFTAGVLVANDDANAQNTTGSSFSTAHEFLAMTMDAAIALPGCYEKTRGGSGDCISRRQEEAATNPRTGTAPQTTPTGPASKGLLAGWWGAHHPGLNQYLDARLTAIPVAPSPNSSGSGSTSANSNSSILTTQNTATLEVGMYAPVLTTRWTWDGTPNSMFLAPLAKVGFDTLTGPTQQTVAAPTGGTETLSYENVYNFYSFGARFGQYALTGTYRHAPDALSYLDVTYGRYSNLQSYVCHLAGGSGGPLYAGSTCPTGNLDSRKRLYRLDFRGFMKMPRVPIILGLDANIRQEVIGAARLDLGLQPPDDVRVLFGTRLDLSSVLSRLNLSSGSSSASKPGN